MSKISDININLAKVSDDRNKGDNIIADELLSKIEKRNQNDKTISKIIFNESENRDNKVLELNNKIKNIEDKRLNDRKILLDKIDKLEAKIRNLKTKNGFIVKNKQGTQLVESNIEFKVVPITRNLPPTMIELQYGECKIRYTLDKDAKVGYLYNDNIYTPADKYLLRYSESGIVTLDYRVCRVTIIGNDKLTLSVE